MSEHITHLAICDDVTRLALHHPGMHERIRELLVRERDVVHMGTITRSADRWSADVIDWSRQQYRMPADQRDPHLDRKLAFVLGSLPHRAADRLMKPILAIWKEHGRPGENVEATIHMDIFSLREVYGGGVERPFSPALLAMPGDELGQKVEEFLRVIMRRQLIAMHTFAPDQQNIHEWMTGLFERMQTFPKDLRQYARIAAEWDPVKVKKYLIDQRFYNRDDGLIAAARSIQQGNPVDGGRLAGLVQQTQPGHSRYARALAKGLEYLLAAGELLEGRISIDGGKQRFDVGVPELALRE